MSDHRDQTPRGRPSARKSRSGRPPRYQKTRSDQNVSGLRRGDGSDGCGGDSGDSDFDVADRAKRRMRFGASEDFGWGLSRAKSMASGMDLVVEPVSAKKSFFESVADVGAEVGKAANKRVDGMKGGGSARNLQKSNPALNKSIGAGLNDLGTEFLGLRYLDGTYRRDDQGQQQRPSLRTPSISRGDVSTGKYYRYVTTGRETMAAKFISLSHALKPAQSPYCCSYVACLKRLHRRAQLVRRQARTTTSVRERETFSYVERKSRAKQTFFFSFCKLRPGMSPSMVRKAFRTTNS